MIDLNTSETAKKVRKEQNLFVMTTAWNFFVYYSKIENSGKTQSFFSGKLPFG